MAWTLLPSAHCGRVALELNPAYYTLISGDSSFTGSGLDGNTAQGKACGAAFTNGLLTVAAAVGGPKAAETIRA
jgi:hypothetical protein